MSRPHISIGKRLLLAKTCTKCLKVKQGREFCITHGYYASYCNSCKNEKSRPVTHNHQDKSLSAAVRHRQPWTEIDLAKLRGMVSEGLPAAQMTIALNRTVYGVYTMKHKLEREN